MHVSAGRGENMKASLCIVSSLVCAAAAAADG